MYHDIGHLNPNIETPHCRCIPQVKATDIYFLWALDVQNKKNKEEDGDGELWAF